MGSRQLIPVVYYRSHYYPFTTNFMPGIYRTKVKPGKHSDTRIKLFPLTNGHGRCTTVTPERKPASVGGWRMAVTCGRYEFVTVSLLKRLRGGCFTSETSAWRFQKRNGHLDPEVVLKIRWGS
jgi:hypothetical protein